MIHQIYTEQQLYCDIDTAWKFFSSPHNLSKITPKDMNFVVLSDIKEDSIYKGMIIDYTVSPLLGVPMRWKTRISQVDHLKSFTDFQEKGPYKLWNHHHEFIQNQEGVLMKDTVDYELPLGFLGNIVNRLVVRKKVQHIFDHRFQVLEQLFNKQTK